MEREEKKVNGERRSLKVKKKKKEENRKRRKHSSTFFFYSDPDFVIKLPTLCRMREKEKKKTKRMARKKL